MADRALSGIRILDLTQWEAGPSCTQLLGWLGADVIRVENPSGDPSRHARPWDKQEHGDLDGDYFLLFNSNKRDIAIDLKHPEGRELLLKMVPLADVVIENFAPGVIERLDLDYPVLREVNSRIIMARIKGFGLSGPYRDYKAFEFIAQAASGVMSGNGFPGMEPVRVGAGIGDSGTGLHAAIAILAAYIQCQRTGEGQLVEVSMQEAAANFMRIRYSDQFHTGEPATRLGNTQPGAVPYGVFPCAPGGPNDYAFIMVQPVIEKFWGDFARAIGREDLLSDPRFRDGPSRYEHRDEINAITRAWTIQRTKREVMRILAGAGVPCSAVLDTQDVLDDPHMNERGAIVTVNHATRGTFRMPGCPVRLSASQPVTTPAPTLGQHTDEVLAELLGTGDREIADLRTRGIVA